MKTFEPTDVKNIKMFHCGTYEYDRLKKRCVRAPYCVLDSDCEFKGDTKLPTRKQRIIEICDRLDELDCDTVDIRAYADTVED